MRVADTRLKKCFDVLTISRAHYSRSVAFVTFPVLRLNYMSFIKFSFSRIYLRLSRISGKKYLMRSHSAIVRAIRYPAKERLLSTPVPPPLRMLTSSSNSGAK